MHDVVAALQQGIEREQLAGARLLLAVSGGADSMVLLRGLERLRYSFNLTLAVAHFDHRLRGQASEADARWVSEQCAMLGVPCYRGEADHDDDSGPAVSGEEAARRQRYRFLDMVARREAFPFILTAHTADDQVETVLHHIVRGTGLNGLSGIPSRRHSQSGVTYVRLLLAVRRAEVETFLAECGQDYRTDASNIDTRFTRNRLRHELLPMLREQFNPQVDQSLLRLAMQAAETQAALEQLAAPLLARGVREQSPTCCRLDCTELVTQPPALLRACLVKLWTEAGWPRQQMGFAEWERLAAIVCEGGVATLPGAIDARRRGSLLVLRRTTTDESA